MPTTKSKKVKKASSVLVMVSGGLDSAVLAAHLQAEGLEVHGVSMTYGQTHIREVESAAAIARDLKLKSFNVLAIPQDIFKGSQSPLNDPTQEMPTESYADLRKAKGPSPTYVPFRNGLMVSLATAYAMSQGIDFVALASHADDAHNWAYPDCTPEFNSAMQAAVSVGTYEEVALVTPFEAKSKAEIVGLGLELGVPFHLTWTCYDPQPDACGKCPSCVSRLEAFKANNTPDPIHYVA